MLMAVYPFTFRHRLGRTGAMPPDAGDGAPAKLVDLTLLQVILDPRVSPEEESFLRRLATLRVDGRASLGSQTHPLPVCG
jgi:hypothetical protein